MTSGVDLYRVCSFVCQSNRILVEKSRPNLRRRILLIIQGSENLHLERECFNTAIIQLHPFVLAVRSTYQKIKPSPETYFKDRNALSVGFFRQRGRKRSSDVI